MARVGQFDQRVTFQSETTASDGQGGTTSQGWANIAETPSIWARVQVAAGDEAGREDRQVNAYRLQITIRNRLDVSELMRVVWRGRAYNIRSVDPYDARRETRQIVAEGGVPL